MTRNPPAAVLELWSAASTSMFRNAVDTNRAAIRANRAAVEAIGPPSADPGDDPDGTGNAGGDETAAGPSVEERIEPAADLDEWSSTVEAVDEPTVGDTATFTKTLTEDDVDRFAAASGDTNPLHLDEAWASETRFGGRIVHGTLVAGLISAALARFPGSVIYLSQDLEFRAPVRIGDRVTAEATVVEALGDDKYRLTTTVEDGDTRIIDGEAVVIIDDPPA